MRTWRQWPVEEHYSLGEWLRGIGALLVVLAYCLGVYAAVVLIGLWLG